MVFEIFALGEAGSMSGNSYVFCYQHRLHLIVHRYLRYLITYKADVPFHWYCISR